MLMQRIVVVQGHVQLQTLRPGCLDKSFEPDGVEHFANPQYNLSTVENIGRGARV